MYVMSIELKRSRNVLSRIVLGSKDNIIYYTEPELQNWLRPVTTMQTHTVRLCLCEHARVGADGLCMLGHPAAEQSSDGHSVK